MKLYSKIEYSYLEKQNQKDIFEKIKNA